MDKTEKKDLAAREGKFVYESVQDAQGLTKYLEALKEGFEKGSMTFNRKDLELVLSPSGLIGFTVEAKAKDGRMKLALKFSWRETVEPRETEEDALHITPSGER